jgi:hypothetical protein
MIQDVCQDNTANLISTLIAAGLLIVSEIMPFIKSQDNGILQSVVSRLKERFPMTGRPANALA